MNRTRTIALIGMLLLGVCSAGCHPEIVASSGAGLWSEGLLVGYARRLEAPSVAWGGEAWLAVWADADALFVRLISSGIPPAAPQVLLTGHQPWAPALIPAAEHEYHLFWYDLDPFGDVRIYAAHIGADGTLLRGPIPITSAASGESAVAPDGIGGALLLWSAAGEQPILYGQRLDSQGRPQAGPAPIVAYNAEYPALARTTDGRWVAAWLALPDSPYSPSTSREMTIWMSEAPLLWKPPAAPLVIGQFDLPDPASYIESVTLGLDRAYGYLFINLRNARDNQVRTEVYPFPLTTGEATLAPVTPLTVYFPATPPETFSTLPTGFNTGPALAVPSPASTPVVTGGSAAPAAGQFDVLPVAFTVNQSLVVGYFHAGELIAYQPVTSQARRISGLALTTDRDRHLTVTWLTLPPTSNDPATLWMSSTRPASILR